MVTIYEQPVKPVLDLEDGVTVYVPGYSNIGPSEPTLCSTLDEFEGLFGATPYLFRGNQDYNDVNFIKNSPEKGYLYAKGLLSSGLKVLFHRITNLTTIAEDSFGLKKAGEILGLKVKANYPGKAYKGTKVKIEQKSNTLYTVKVNDGEVKTFSLDPLSSIYLKLVNLPLVKIVDSNGADFDDSILSKLISSEGSIDLLDSGEKTVKSLTLTLDGTFGDDDEFSVSDMMSGLAGSLNYLRDFEKYPSVAYLTTGGYYVDKTAASTLVEYAEKISAIALIDMDLRIEDQSSWDNAKTTLAGITGNRGKSAHFAGCNSFLVTPYRVVLADSFNYLTSLGNNMKRGLAPWLPVANDSNGISPMGYGTTQKISSSLAETMAEGNIGISSNPIVYSTSAGGYKIMGNRTLLSNDGVLSPNSFLNVAVIVNRVARAARQTANKLKIVSTDPNSTFLKFKQSVAKTIDPMVVNQDGVLEYKIRLLPKKAPATMDIQIHLVVLEGIEKFNIYIPYELKLD